MLIMTPATTNAADSDIDASQPPVYSIAADQSKSLVV
jgi:hypothetical protein